MLALLIVWPLPDQGRAQQSVAGNRRADLLAVARRMMAAAHYCAFITVDSAGWPQARTVDPLAPDSTMTVWFATNPSTRKVREIRKDPRVTLYYFDPLSQGYVTIIGRARLVNDRAEKARRWKPEWQVFYPDRDKSVLLVEVTPERLEIVSVRDRIQGDSVTWRPPMVEFRRHP